MLVSYKYRIYPNNTQKEIFEKHFNAMRFTWNWALSTKIKALQVNKENLTRFQLSALLTKAKKEFPWLYEVNHQSLQAVLRHLEKAYTRFYRDKKSFPKLKQNEDIKFYEQKGYPNFKSKKKCKSSYECIQGVKVDLVNSLLTLPKCKNIKVKFDREYKGVIKSTVISKTKSNKYFVVLNCEFNSIKVLKPEIKRETSIALDLGLTKFATLSNGVEIENPRYYQKLLNKLQFMQKKLSKKVYGSNNYYKYLFNIIRLHEKISNKRKDFLHKLSYSLTHDSQVDTIILEDLSVQNMQSNRKLAKSISDASWSMFNEFLKYKCERYNKNLLQIGRYEPSSKMCNHCGVINSKLRLSDRVWTCSNCNSINQRDQNAALNILDIGLCKSNLIGRPGWSEVAC
jgi:putative transposase